MKRNAFFKQNFSFSKKISSLYEQEARSFQFRHNSSSSSAPVWRHMLYPRTFYFYRNGCVFSVRVKIIRFRFAGTNRTFTFYGSLFRSFSRFSQEFTRLACAEKDDPFSPVSTLVSTETLTRWAALCANPSFPFTSSGYDTITPPLDKRVLSA